MKNVSIKLKLLAGFIGMIILVIILGGVSIVGFEDQNKISKTISDNSLLSIKAILNIKVCIAEIRNKVYRHIMSNSETDMVKMEEDRKNLVEKLKKIKDEYKNYISSDEEKGYYDNFSMLYDNYFAIEENVIKLSKENKDEEAKNEMTVKSFEEYTKMVAALDKIIEINDADTDKSKIVVNKSFEAIKMIVIGLIIACIIIGIIFSIIIINEITSSLQKISTTLKKLNENDLTGRVDELGKNEIGYMGDYLNKVIINFEEIINNIRDYTLNVSGGTAQLSTTMDQISGSVEELGNSSNTTAAAIEELSSTTTTVSQNVDVLLKSSEATLRLAQNGGSAVKTTIYEINKIKEVVENGTIKVKDLGNKTSEIGEIVTVINDIAAQTNLLALNAAIEAARAGDAGKGFEVVAEEVRKLAEKTTQSTKEISRMVKEIQMETSGVIVKMEEVNAEVEEGVKTANNTGKALEEIVYQTENLKEMVNMIANSTKEQAVAAEEIAKQTENVTNNVEENGRAIEQSTEAIREIADIAEKLNNIVNQFIIDNKSNGNKMRIRN